MFVPSVFIFATAAVTAFFVREKLKRYQIALGLLALALVYAVGVASTRAGFTGTLWLAAIPLAAYVLLFIWYRVKRGSVSAAFFTVLPPVVVLGGYVAAGPFGEPQWFETAFSSAALTTGYDGWTVSGVASFFFVLSALFYLYSPANAIIKGLLSRVGVVRDPSEAEYRRGAIIGTLERWIAFVLVLTGQYTALAFVIAAKSIARYKKINEDEKFGEYFLIGTLTSIGIALFFGIIVNKFFA